jgi:predicted RNA-binding Zn-ribbon protein involved in translation (DUF1610 family)
MKSYCTTLKEFAEKRGLKRMLCPYCGEIFTVTDTQIRGNNTFVCPSCHRSNKGSAVGVGGVLIGEVSAYRILHFTER